MGLSLSVLITMVCVQNAKQVTNESKVRFAIERRINANSAMQAVPNC